MPTPYPASIPLIADGTPVNSATTNPSLLALAGRTTYLKEMLDSIQLSYQALKIAQVSVTDDVISNTMVYFNASAGKFDLALAELVIETENHYIPSERTFTLGLITNVTGVSGSRKGDIYLKGYIPSLTIADVLASGETFETGTPYFLSQEFPGKIELSVPNLEVLTVMFVGPEVDGVAPAIVDIQYKNVGEDHLHYTVDLDPAEVETFEDHWLYPAELIEPFPPIPWASSSLVINGLTYTYGEDFIVDPDGVHIYDANYTWPPADPMLMVLHFSQPSGTNLAYVLSLTAGTDNVVIENILPGQPADVGNLKISVIPVITETPDQTGISVVKTLTVDAETGEILAETGPYVQNLIAGSNITLSPAGGQGSVTIDALSTNEERPFFDKTVNAPAAEVVASDIDYVQFPTDGYINLKLHTLSEYSKVRLTFSYFGEDSLEGDGLFTVSYKTLSLNDLISEAFVNAALTLPFAAGYAANRVLTETLDITLPSQGVMCFKIIRLTDTYGGNVGIVSIKAEFHN